MTSHQVLALCEGHEPKDPLAFLFGFNISTILSTPKMHNSCIKQLYKTYLVYNVQTTFSIRQKTFSNLVKGIISGTSRHGEPLVAHVKVVEC